MKETLAVIGGAVVVLFAINYFNSNGIKLFNIGDSKNNNNNYTSNNSQNNKPIATNHNKLECGCGCGCNNSELGMIEDYSVKERFDNILKM